MAYMILRIGKDGTMYKAGMYYKAPHANVPNPPRKHWSKDKVRLSKKWNNSNRGGTILRRLFA